MQVKVGCSIVFHISIFRLVCYLKSSHFSAFKPFIKWSGIALNSSALYVPDIKLNQNGVPGGAVLRLPLFQFCWDNTAQCNVCGTVLSMLSGLKTRSLGLNTLGTT